MGVLSDAVHAQRSRPGAPSRLPALLESLPEDGQADLRSLLDDPLTNIAELRRQVMALYPDAPVASESTWFYWRRCWRQGRKF